MRLQNILLRRLKLLILNIHQEIGLSVMTLYDLEFEIGDQDRSKKDVLMNQSKGLTKVCGPRKWTVMMLKNRPSFSGYRVQIM